ncbi:MAG: O-antigen ligase family protein [Phycisphaerae bacterium]
MIAPSRTFDLRIALAALVGLSLGSFVFLLGAKSFLVPLAGLLVLLVLAHPRLGLALTIIAAINFGSFGRFGSTEMLVFLSISKILGVITLGAWILYTLRLKRRITFTKSMLAGALFISCSLISIAYAQHRQIAIADFLKLAANFVLYFLIVNLIETLRHLKQFILIIMVMGLIASVVAAAQYVSPALQVSGETTVIEFGKHEAAIANPEELQSGEFTRPTGGLGHPNWLSVFLVSILAFNVYVLKSDVQKPIKLFALMVLSFELLALVLTHDRIGFVGMATVFLLLLAKKVLEITPLRIVAMLFMIGLFVIAVPKTYLERVFSIEHYKQSASISARWELQTAGFDIFLDNWLFGVGQGNFGPVFMKTNTDVAADTHWLIETAKSNYQDYWMGAHNMYLEVAVETGIIGLFTLLLFLATGILDTHRTAELAAKTGKPIELDLAKVLQICLVAFCIAALFLHAQDQKIWWIVMGLLAAAKKIVEWGLPHHEGIGGLKPTLQIDRP